MSLSPPPPAASAEAAPTRHRTRRTGRTTRRMPSDRDATRGRLARQFSLLLLFAMAQGLFLFSPLFRLAEVVVRGNERLSNEAVARQAKLEPGSYLWALSPDEVGKRVLALREIRTASVSLSVPGRITLDVREREPVALVTRAPGPCRWFEVDSEGVILGPARVPGPLPRVRLEGEVPPQGRVDPVPLLLALKARTWLEPSLPGPVEVYEVDETQSVSAWTRFLDVPVEVQVGPLQDMDYKMHVLRALLERLKAEKRLALAIDLRFKSPVVRPLRPEPVPSPTP